MQSPTTVYRLHPRRLFSSTSVAPIYFLAYFLAGIATVALGPILPQLVRNWSMNDVQAGLLFAALFLGSAVGSLLSTQRPECSYPIGCGCCGIAILSIGSASIGWLWPVILLEGIGLGLIINSGNVLVGRTAEEAGVSGAAALSKVHFAWGVGAVLCPWIIHSDTRHLEHSSQLFPLLGGVFVLLGLYLAWKIQPSPRAPSSESTTAQPTLIRLQTQTCFALALLLYTGIENSISGWLPSFALRIYGEEPSRSTNGSTSSDFLAVLSFTLLWAAHLFGRASVPFALHLWKEARILKATVSALLVSVSLLATLPGLFNDHGVALCVVAAACGLSLASIYPLMIALVLRLSENLRSMGWIFACAPLGAATLPWLSGVASTYSGNIRSALFIPSLAGVLLLILVFRLNPANED